MFVGFASLTPSFLLSETEFDSIFVAVRGEDFDK
jgi:hypothetical protein